MVRPRGDIALALQREAALRPAPVRDLAQRAQVGLGAAKYTASRLVAAGQLAYLTTGRPAIVGLPVDAPQAPLSGMDRLAALQQLENALFARQPRLQPAGDAWARFE